MFLSEEDIRKIVRDVLDKNINERTLERLSQKVKNFGMEKDDQQYDDFDLGDYSYSFSGSGKYIMPVPIFNKTDYTQKKTSPPQEKRTDVGDVKDSATGKVTKRGSHSHRGYDFGVPVGTPIVSFLDGQVINVNTNPGANAGGIYVSITHTDAKVRRTSYLHLSRPLVKKGDKVKAGQIVGLSGNTGKSTGPHLHFTVYKTGEEKASFSKMFYDSLFNNAQKVTITKK